MIKKCIIIGTGKLPFLCANEVIKKDVDCTVYGYNEYEHSLLKELCQKNKVTYEKADKEGLIKKLYSIEEKVLVISANNLFIFPEKIAKKENLMIINFHPALLPMHPGRNAEAWSIYEEDEESGITWHVVNEKIDNGKILIQKVIKLDKKTTSLKLMMNQIQLAFEAFKEIIDSLITQDIETWDKQVFTTQSGYGMHLSTDIPNGGLVDIKWGISKLSAFLRSMDYGKLCIMGIPRCKIGDVYYVWDKYEIHANESGIITDIQKGIFADDRLVINLVGFRKMERKDERETV